MQSTSEYMNIIYNGVVIKYKEINIPDKSYCKLVTSDGHTAVLVSPAYGGGWSTGTYEPDIKHQLIFDSQIVLFVLSQEFKDNYKRYNINAEAKYKYEEFITSIIPHICESYIPSVDAFKNLAVKFIPENTMFHIKEYDGAEEVVIFKPESYYTS
jgi:hypothetical protein